MDPVAAFRQQPHGEHCGHGFPRSRFAHHADDLTPFDLQRDVIQRVDLTAKNREAQVQVFNA